MKKQSKASLLAKAKRHDDSLKPQLSVVGSPKALSTTPKAQKAIPDAKKAQEVVFRRRSRGLVGRIIAGASKSGMFLLPGIFMFNTLLYSQHGVAGTRCEVVQPVRGCVSSFAELYKEQKRIDQYDKKIRLEKSVVGVFSDVNGKDLVLNYFGRHSLKIKFSASKVDVVYNGESTEEVQLCYEACPNEKSSVTWYSDKHGEFKHIDGGLSVGGYEFKIDASSKK